MLSQSLPNTANKHFPWTFSFWFCSPYQPQAFQRTIWLFMSLLMKPTSLIKHWLTRKLKLLYSTQLTFPDVMACDIPVSSQQNSTASYLCFYKGHIYTNGKKPERISFQTTSAKLVQPCAWHVFGPIDTVTSNWSAKLSLVIQCTAPKPKRTFLKLTRKFKLCPF